MGLTGYPRLLWSAALLAVIACPTPALCAGQFQQFFPGWSHLIGDILKNNCSQSIGDYNESPYGEAKWTVIDCVLGVFSESRKAEVAAAALTLGLTPTILQSVGASTAEMSLLFLRRPFLALLLSAASPAPSNPTSSRYADTLAAMHEPVNISARPAIMIDPRPIVKALISLMEYALAGMAAANVAVLAYQLGYWSFFASANNIYDPALWTYTAILIHLCGVIGLCLQINVTEEKGRERFGGTVRNWFLRGFRHEIVPTAFGEPLILSRRRASMWSYFVSWILSIAPTLQVLFGTITLSGSLLMSQQDARDCLFRYLFSAVVARAILSYELSGIREASCGIYGAGTQENQALLVVGKNTGGGTS